MFGERHEDRVPVRFFTSTGEVDRFLRGLHPDETFLTDSVETDYNKFATVYYSKDSTGDVLSQYVLEVFGVD
jgi:hypothetical protein